MSLSREDRDNVNAMHHVANGIGSGTSEASRKRSPRDDFGRQPVWKLEPVPIQPPGSQRHSSNSGQRPIPKNPFTQSTYSDLTGVSPRTNPSARALVRVPNRTHTPQTNQLMTKSMFSNPPLAKKQKLETPSMTAYQKTPAATKSRQPRTLDSTGSMASNSAPEGPYPATAGSSCRSTNGHLRTTKATIPVSNGPLQLSSPTTRPIVIDLDSEEDLGVPVSNSYAKFTPQTPPTSSDDLRLISSHGNTDHNNSTPDSIGKILGVSKPSDQHVFGRCPPTHTIKPPPSAGPHTSALKAQITDCGHATNGADNNETDSIEDADEFDTIPRGNVHSERKGTSSVFGNVVKKNVLFFESQARPREVDLTTVKRKKINSMKTKTPASTSKNAHAFDLGKPPSARRDPPPHSPVHLSLTTYKTTDGRQRGAVFPLEAYACGSQITESVNSEEPTPKLWVRIQDMHVSIVHAPIEDGHVLVDLELGRDIRNAQLPHGGDTVEKYPLLVFALSSTDNARSLFTHTKNFENQNPLIMLKPLTSHERWSAAEFENMCNDMKAKAKISFAFVSAHAFRAQWEAVRNIAEIAPADQPQSQVARYKPKPRPTYAGATEASSASTSSGVRRSTRQMTSNTQPPSSPSPPADDIILLYPPTGTGAVNVTYGDLKRLEPGEFLNDTLIELGLKLWLRDLRDQQPDFADQVHVFSSFFYTQLNQKNLEEGYQSVRKWTSKFDLFQKKYIIVPINEHLHWYLAIICHPSLALQQPPAPQVVKPNVTTRTRALGSQITTTNSQEPISSHEKSISTQAPNSEASDASMTTAEDEQEVERAVRVCPTASIPSRPTSPSSSVSSLTVQPDNENIGMEIIPASDSEGEDNAMRVDVSMEPKSSRSVPPSLRGMSPIPSKNFYEHTELSGSNLRDGMRVASEVDEEEVDQLQDDDLMDVDTIHSTVEPVTPEQPYIFSFDSLGTRHPHALKVLSRYLEMEAKDKKGWEEIVQPVVKPASVPAQPNYCDCGVYLLHFVEQFMSDPDSFSQQILHQKPKKVVGPDKLERERLWSHDKVAGRRQELKQKIVSLSTEWRREKQVDGKGKGRDQVEDQPAGTKSIDHDSDIEVVEMGPKPIKNPKTPRTHKAARLR